VCILNFFDKKSAVDTHGFVKNFARVPPAEIERARRFREHAPELPRHIVSGALFAVRAQRQAEVDVAEERDSSQV
jgi:hypothetical protein